MTSTWCEIWGGVKEEFDEAKKGEEEGFLYSLDSGKKLDGTK